jgi:hypothetical protein
VRSDRAHRDTWVTERLRQIHKASREVYARRSSAPGSGLEHKSRVGRKRVARLMKAAGSAGVTTAMPANPLGGCSRVAGDLVFNVVRRVDPHSLLRLHRRFDVWRQWNLPYTMLKLPSSLPGAAGSGSSAARLHRSRLRTRGRGCARCPSDQHIDIPAYVEGQRVPVA